MAHKQKYIETHPDAQMYPLENTYENWFSNVATVEICPVHPRANGGYVHEQFMSIIVSDIYGTKKTIRISSRFGGKGGGKLRVINHLNRS